MTSMEALSITWQITVSVAVIDKLLWGKMQSIVQTLELSLSAFNPSMAVA